ncbi:MAG TPA: DNA polymerase III subunit gamma and tau [Nocardioides sp.]|uniref:DNA polymerase III subunit gamma and tau n=1 Tax=Nocardioides sp. TaxID=35761 RepID=UPI002C418B2D|nr:DNA polymerase III subunit gamma and tau [Nocardioides sp.]HTW14660.1 DNA polymerase III subunit gamma and tau [Nocardioides sp.]
MESPLALYRRYRPETFAEVIGQDHVTEPLRSALANNRVNHAYLFSGPRGCGKTTSARILARALNCEKAPVADPCGECESCRDLARGGPGSIDVIEIDAASHGGVDDARDLREKAFFSPVRSRYKVYIIDEAHMVTTQGFNALLKLVEEPPPHLRFIFATTEPEKVLPTIRSRTHHYPFRLIPPRLLSSYLSELCAKEQVAIEPAALPLVVRAGAGSARDTLSVLDQLLGGSGPAGVTHELATGLLGYTPDTLLDEVVDAFAAADGAAVFGVIDKVIETGQDPRRFTEDLLRRLRDLVIVAAVPEATASGLIDVSEDQGDRLVAQAARFGAAELSRAADLVAIGLTEMRGATAPRLLLELICARVLLPGADHSTAGLMARIDRLEKRLTITGVPSAAATPQAVPAPPAQDRPADVSVASDRASEAAPPPTPPVESRRPVDPPAAPEREPEQAPQARPEPPAPVAPTPEPVAAPVAPPTAPAPAAAAPAADPAAGGGLSLVDVRRLWPDIVEATKLRRRVAWMILTQNCQVVSIEGRVLTIGFSNAGARDSFVAGGCDEVFRQAAIDVVGADWKIDTIVDPGTQPGSGGAPATPHPPAGQPEPAAPAAPVDHAAAPPADAAPPAPDAPPDWAAPEPAPERPGPDAIALAREAVQQTRPAGVETPRPEDTTGADADAHAHRDDLDADDGELGGAELLARELGARIVEEIPHQ